MQASADNLAGNITAGVTASHGVVMENLGTLIVITVDIVFGLISLALMFSADLQPDDLMSWLLVILSSMLSFLTSAVQYVLWKVVFNVDEWWKRIVALAPGIALMILDTGIDASLANWLIYRKSPLDFPLPLHETNLMYWFTYFMILIGTGFNEPLVNLFRYRDRLLKPKKGATKQSATVPQSTQVQPQGHSRRPTQQQQMWTQPKSPSRNSNHK